MKKLILICLAFAFVACGSPEKTAQKLITGYLKENLKDPDSYQPAEFGKLDSAYTSFDDQAKVFSARFDAAKAESKLRISQKDLPAMQASIANMKQLMEEWEKAEGDFKPEFAGWKMQHKYRAKNGYGATDISVDTFCFDEGMTKVVDVVSQE